MPENGERVAVPWFRHYAEALWMVVKGRKGRHLFLTVLLATVTIVLLWSYSTENLSPAAVSGHRGDDELWRAENDRHVHATASAEAVSQTPSSTNEANSTKTDNDNDNAATATPKLDPLPFTAKNGPTFRLLIPAAESDANFCRSILSTMLLDYPPPTILGYNSRDQTASIVGAIYAHLEDPHIRDDDLILVADGYRAWFQLPSLVLVRQYQRVTAAANQRLKKTYGVLRGGQGAEKQQRFRQTVLFAADTHCWHYTDDDVACDAVPDAPGVWERAYANAAKNTSAIFNPKFLNSGIVMGPARDLRAVFAAASKKSTGAGGAHDLQHALQTMYSEQEQAREAVRRANLGAAGRVREWLYSTVYGYAQSQFLRGRRSSSASGGGLGMSRRHLTIEAGRDYDFAIGLDYGSALFQSMSAPHSFNGDVEFLAAADALAFPDPSMHALPPALAALPSPFFLPPADKASEDIPDNTTTPLTLTPGLDDLPEDLPWSALPLARNLLSGAAPASLHFPPRLWASSGDSIGARSPHASYSSPQTNSDGSSTSSSSTNSQANHPSTPHHRLSPLYNTPQRPKDRSSSSSSHSTDSTDSTPDTDGIDPGTDTTTPPTFAHLDPRDSVYRHLWFAPHARALLRRHMRRTTFRSLLNNEIAAVEEASSPSHPNHAPNSPNHDPNGSRWQTQRDRDLHFDRRGGAGGVWTQQGEWLAWGDVCRGVEGEVFGPGDGWGEWGKERASRGMFEDARKVRKMPVARPVDEEKGKEKEKENNTVGEVKEGGQGDTRPVARPAEQETETTNEKGKVNENEAEAAEEHTRLNP